MPFFQVQVSENRFPSQEFFQGPRPMAEGHGPVSIHIGYVPRAGMARDWMASHRRSVLDICHDLIRGQYGVGIVGCHGQTKAPKTVLKLRVFLHFFSSSSRDHVTRNNTNVCDIFSFFFRNDGPLVKFLGRKNAHDDD